VFSELIQQESGGRAGVQGPPTPYGRALGLTQMLPDTARGVAARLGLPYREDLLRGRTPEAIEYQRALGRDYLREGFERYPNDTRSALMFYHGGPDTRIWGRRTRRYADEILGRLRGP
jgi:soluble lytic murein transglycosylase